MPLQIHIIVLLSIRLHFSHSKEIRENSFNPFTSLANIANTSRITVKYTLSQYTLVQFQELM